MYQGLLSHTCGRLDSGLLLILVKGKKTQSKLCLVNSKFQLKLANDNLLTKKNIK